MVAYQKLSEWKLILKGSEVSNQMKARQTKIIELPLPFKFEAEVLWLYSDFIWGG